MQEPEIGFFLSPFRNNSVQIPLAKALSMIKEETYTEIIREARFYYEKDKARYFNLKTSLPAFTFSGIFGEARKLAYLKKYTNLIVLDLDNLGSENINKTKKQVFQDKLTYATWVSPSGNGLKILAGIFGPKEFHRNSFDLLVNHYQKEYGLKIDLSGSDITRLCFLSSDENLLVKKSLQYNKVYKPHDHLSFKLKKSILKTAQKRQGIASGDEINRQLFFDKKGRNKFEDQEMISRIIGFLTEKKLSITENYESWYRVALAIANTFTYDLGINYFLDLCRLDGVKHDEEKSIGLLEYCYRNRRIGEISLRSLIYFAVRKGFITRDTGELS
jgi:hypothetical protein